MISPDLAETVKRLERERDEARKLIYVPGQWRCAKCKFVCQRMILNAFSGAVGVQADTKTEPCPNGCGPLWPVTERQAGNDLCDRLEAAFENEKVLKARITSLESSLAEARKGARTAAPNDLLDFANEVMSLHEVGTPEYRLAEYVWVNRAQHPTAPQETAP